MSREQPEIARVLVISTGHLSQETAFAISENGYDFFPTLRREEGFMVWVPTDDLMDSQEVPDDLKDVMRYAIGLGVEWVMFDRDGDHVSVLRRYEW